MIHLETDKCTSVPAVHVSFCVLLYTCLHPSRRHFQESSHVLWLLADHVWVLLESSVFIQAVQSKVFIQSLVFPSSLGMLGIEPGTVHSWRLLSC